jgi:hypothetical protein
MSFLAFPLVNTTSILRTLLHLYSLEFVRKKDCASTQSNSNSYFYFALSFIGSMSSLQKKKSQRWIAVARYLLHDLVFPDEGTDGNNCKSS